MKKSILAVLGLAIAAGVLLTLALRPTAPPSRTPATAVATPAANPILIAHVIPSSGRFATHAEADRRGVQMAIDEFNERGGVLGREVVLVSRDPTLDPQRAAQVATELIEQTKISFMVGAIHSGIAASMSAVCQQHGVIFINTNSSSHSESTTDAHRTKFVFDAHGANFDRALMRFALANRPSKKVLLLTEDYVFGHSNAAAARKLIAQAGGTVIGEIVVPEAMPDPARVVEQIAASEADVVVVGVTGDNQIKLFAQVDPTLLERQFWLLNEVDWPELYTAPGTMRPLFGTTWAWNLDTPGTRDFVARYRERYGHTKLDYPGDVVHGAYLGAKALLTAIERAGTTENHAVIRELERYTWTAEERMQHDGAYMEPNSHHVQQTIYIARWNTQIEKPELRLEILGRITPEEAADPQEKNTVLETVEATPVFAP
ncbi:MAG: ABC transporter substrate-binding protein [Thiohalomonadaceae bacterium]